MMTDGSWLVVCNFPLRQIEQSPVQSLQRGFLLWGMNMKINVRRALCALLAAGVSTMGLFSNASAESAFVGSYRHGDVDSVSQLFVLDDHTFCYTFMGGALDLLAAGRWKATDKAATSIRLEEIRPTQEMFPVFASTLGRQGGFVAFTFDGYSFSNANSPVFAITSTDAAPTVFKPLFPAGKSQWAGAYVLPPVAREDAKYLFVGDVEVDAYNKPLRLRVTQYELGTQDTVRLGFDQLQARPLLQMTARLSGSMLFVDGSKFGAKSGLSPQTIQEVREACIAPALAAEQASGSELNVARDNGAVERGRVLTPIKHFSLSPSAVQGGPVFGDDYQSADTDGDPIAALMAAETAQLNTAFQSAMGNPKTLDNFLQTAKTIAEIQPRIRKHAATLVPRYAELMVKITASGDMAASERMLHFFIDFIAPHTQPVPDGDAQYAASVIASQGIIVAAAKNSSQLGELVHAKLLGSSFDIHKTRNPTLIYNLACYYSLQNQKPAMLDAVRQARVRGKPTAQFMKDTDFKNYWADPEFLSAVK